MVIKVNMKLKGLLTVLAAVITMLVLGTIYAWSIYLPRLIMEHGYSTGQTQLIFGVLIGIFTVAMVIARPLLGRWGPSKLAMAAAIIYGLGYVLAGIMGPGFGIMFIGLSLLAGVGTGVGYLISISIPVEWYPARKGLITGLVSAGFGGGAIIESLIVEGFLADGTALTRIFLVMGVIKGILLLVASFFFRRPAARQTLSPLMPMKRLIKDVKFLRLFFGIFIGTFGGLLIIGNLKPIGGQYPIDETILVLGITVFSLANFTGRLFWGWLNDLVSGKILMPLSLILTGVVTLMIGLFALDSVFYLAMAFGAGFSYGANFVIYAKETAQIYGLDNLGKIYPLVFLGYGISGIAGPYTGGWLHDIFGSYQPSMLVASALCVLAFVGMIRPVGR